MTTPVPDADAAEQRRPVTPDLSPDDPSSVEPGDGGPAPAGGDEAAEADLAEQAHVVGPAASGALPDLPFEADAADAAEQAQVVPLDEDEGRE